jgi:hypothetical protein
MPELQPAFDDALTSYGRSICSDYFAAGARGSSPMWIR